MISHCCGRCGLPLDASHRRHVASVGMWVATCPRCGFAARWALRAAREPARLWSRLRALNTRSGIAFGAAHAAAIALVGLSAHLVDHAIDLRLYGSIGPVEQARVLVPSIALGALAALLAAISALAFAPWRGVLARLASAWFIGILPMFVAVCCFLLLIESLDGGTSSRGFWSHLRNLSRALGEIVLILASVPVASFAILLAASPLLDAVSRLRKRSHRHAITIAREGLGAARAA